jgi:hypothetical protein
MPSIPFRCDSFRTRVMIATTSCLQAWKADTTSAGVRKAPAALIKKGMQKAWKAETPWIETAFITLRP